MARDWPSLLAQGHPPSTSHNPGCSFPFFSSRRPPPSRPFLLNLNLCLVFVLSPRLPLSILFSSPLSPALAVVEETPVLLDLSGIPQGHPGDVAHLALGVIRVRSEIFFPAPGHRDPGTALVCVFLPPFQTILYFWIASCTRLLEYLP